MNKSTISSGFGEAGLLRDVDDSTSYGVTLSQDESDTESHNEGKAEEVCGQVYLRLFRSHTEEEDSHGFSAEEENKVSRTALAGRANSDFCFASYLVTAALATSWKEKLLKL